MASEPQVSEISTLFERLMSNNRDLSTFLPFLLGFNQENPGPDPDPDPDPEYENTSNPRDRIIIINPSTQGMVVIQGASTFDSLLRELRSKNGQPPASKASIEAMPTEEIREEADCTICLDEFEIGSRVRKMPCDHKFHGDCIKTWLELHGSCPIFRFLLPADKDDVGKKKSEREIWVSLSFNGGESNGDSNHTSSNEFDRSSSTSEELEG